MNKVRRFCESDPTIGGTSGIRLCEDHAATLDKINVVPLPGSDSTAILY